MKVYIFPCTVALLILLFFMGLPETRSACKKETSITRKDVLIMAVFTCLFGFVDFFRLGSTISPETFADVVSRPAIIETESQDIPVRLMLFSGPQPGNVTVEASEDGKHFSCVEVFDQNYAQILKWHEITLDCDETPKFIRIYGTERAMVGEVVLLDDTGAVIPAKSDQPLLVDEQTAPGRSNYFNSSYFDEIYHVRTAWEHINSIFPYETSHPPLGKLIIAAGIKLFGMTPFGWRFSGTFFGVLMLPALYVFAKKLFGSARCAACTMLLMATDFMHYVQTRIATIDTYAVFFIILMYLFMYLFITEEKNKWLFWSGLFFGIGAASKWTCIYAGAGLAVIWALYWIEKKEGFIKNALLCLVYFVLIPCVIYWLSYIPYAKALEIPVLSSTYTQKVLEMQGFMFSYHSKLVAEHPYSSHWYEWMLNIRPILYFMDYMPDGTRSTFGAYVNPVLCWGGLIAVLMLFYFQIKDITARFILIGYLAQLIPWIFVTRLTFEYHYFPCTVFLALALGYVFTVYGEKKKHYVYAFTLLSAVLFAFFYPTLSGAKVPANVWYFHWLPSWPF